MMDKDKLLAEIKVFCERHGMTPSGFGRWALKNPNFVSDLERVDFSPLLKTANKVKLRMKTYKPRKGEKYAE